MKNINNFEETKVRGIVKSTFKNPHKSWVDGWVDPRGNFTSLESHHHVEVALRIITSQNGNYLEEFKQANQNKGHDAAEHLILRHGYIAIESGYMIYSRLSMHQVASIGLLCMDGIITDRPIPRSQTIDTSDRAKQVLMMKKKYYSDFSNQFHSPGGYPREGWLKYKAECESLGIRP